MSSFYTKAGFFMQENRPTLAGYLDKDKKITHSVIESIDSLNSFEIIVDMQNYFWHPGTKLLTYS
jgi:hypothetical protein